MFNFRGVIVGLSYTILVPFARISPGSPDSSEDRSGNDNKKQRAFKRTELVGKNMAFKKDGSVIIQILFIFTKNIYIYI